MNTLNPNTTAVIIQALVAEMLPVVDAKNDAVARRLEALVQRRFADIVDSMQAAKAAPSRHFRGKMEQAAQASDSILNGPIAVREQGAPSPLIKGWKSRAPLEL